MERIGHRTNQRLTFEAGLHGIDLSKASGAPIEPVSLTKEQRALMDAELEKSIARKRREMMAHG